MTLYPPPAPSMQKSRLSVICPWDCRWKIGPPTVHNNVRPLQNVYTPSDQFTQRAWAAEYIEVVNAQRTWSSSCATKHWEHFQLSSVQCVHKKKQICCNVCSPKELKQHAVGQKCRVHGFSLYGHHSRCVTLVIECSDLKVQLTIKQLFDDLRSGHGFSPASVLLWKPRQ